MGKRKSSRGRVLVSAKGRKNYKNINAYKDAIRKNKNLTASQKRGLMRDLDAYVEQRSKDNRNSPGNRLTTNGFEGHLANNDLDRLFANIGMSAKEMSERYGIDENELLDISRWNGDEFTDSNGDVWELMFGYTEEALRKK